MLQKGLAVCGDNVYSLHFLKSHPMTKTWLGPISCLCPVLMNEVSNELCARVGTDQGRNKHRQNEVDAVFGKGSFCQSSR